VGRGQLLAEIEPTDYRNAVNAAVAQKEAAQKIAEKADAGLRKGSGAKFEGRSYWVGFARSLRVIPAMQPERLARSPASLQCVHQVCRFYTAPS
jgi:multidrug efflux pump subunit AcrA (membrane-fusion protein)